MAPFIDGRTLLIVHVTSGALGVVVMIQMWLQHRKRFPGILLWLVHYCMQLAALVNLALRGLVHDFASIFAANLLIVGSGVVLLRGLERFVQKAGPHAQNYLMLAAFAPLIGIFTFVYPSLPARSVCFATGTFFVAFQGAWLLLRRVEPVLRPATRATGFVLVAFCVTAAAQVFNHLTRTQSQDLLHSDSFGVLTLAAYQTLFVALTLTLTLMVSRRLRIDLEHELLERRQAEQHLRESEERFSKAFHTSPYAIAMTRLQDGRFLEVNDALCAMSGYSKTELSGKTSLSLGLWMHEQDRWEMAAALEQGQAVVGRELQFRNRDGRLVVGLFSAQTVELGENRCVLASILDITARRLADQELSQSRRFLAELIEHSGALIYTKDAAGAYQLVNRKWEQVTGVPRERALGCTDQELFPGSDGSQYRSNDLKVLETGTPIEAEETLEGADGKKWFVSVKFPLRSNDDHSVVGVCGMSTEISERKRAEEQIRHLATHDHLTNLPTMRLARDRLEMAVRLARRERRAACVMFVDLDGFKDVNDTRGHAAGDHLLQELAARMTSGVRQTDTVARVGGDEFLVIASGLHCEEDATLIARKVLERVSRPVYINGHDVSVGASIGIALYPHHGEDIDQLIKLADQAMYKVKRSGKRAFCMAELDHPSPGFAAAPREPREQASGSAVMPTTLTPVDAG